MSSVECRVSNIECIIVTGDKDTLQLVNDNTKVYSMSRGLTDSIIYNLDTVKEKMGVRADQVVDYKALRGDPSDNIPGVPGIGEKTAVELLREFDNLDKLYEHVEHNTQHATGNTKQVAEVVKPRILELLKAHKESAYLSRELATIKCDVGIEFDLEATRFFDLDKDRIVGALSDLEFKSLLPRVQSMFNDIGLDTKEKKQEATDDKFSRDKADFKYELINDDKKFEKFLVELKKQKSFVFDVETSGLDPLTCDLLGVSFAWEEGRAYFVECRLLSVECRVSSVECVQESLFGGEKKNIKNERRDWLEKIKPIFGDESIKKMGHNAKFDIRVLENKGVVVRGLVFDTMIASYLLNPGARGNGLDALTFSELGFEKISKGDLLGTGKDKINFSDVDLEKLSLYSCEDADFTFRLVKALRLQLVEKKLEKLFLDIELPLVRVLGDMEDRGIKIDSAFLNKMSKKMTKEIKILEDKIIEHAGESFNVRSTKQLKHILFEKLNLATDNIKKTKTGFSTGFDELDKLKDLHPIIPLIIEHRELTKLVSTYIDTLPLLVNQKTGRVHTSFNQAVAATGRLSSTDPNLQNIPVRTELGREIRKAFIAEPGFKLVALDYSQIELRLAAHMSGDEKMIKAFQDGADIHSATAAEINNVKPEEVTSEMRREAKAINFGVLYGQGAYGLARSADIPFARAKEFIDNYFCVYTGVAKYIEEKIVEAKEHGYVETLFGRKRYLPEIASSVMMVKKAAERMAVNTPIQGTAADMIKLAMIKIADEINDKDIRMLLQVHDELIFEVKEDKVQEAVIKIKNIMENILKLKVPVIVDAKVGESWGEMEKV